MVSSDFWSPNKNFRNGLFSAIWALSYFACNEPDQAHVASQATVVTRVPEQLAHWPDWSALKPTRLDTRAQGIGPAGIAKRVRKGTHPSTGQPVFIKICTRQTIDGAVVYPECDEEKALGLYFNSLALALKDADTSARQAIEAVMLGIDDTTHHMAQVASHRETFGLGDYGEKDAFVQTYEEALLSIQRWQKVDVSYRRILLKAILPAVQNTLTEPVAAPLLGTTRDDDGDEGLVFAFVDGDNVDIRARTWFEVGRAMQMHAQLAWYETQSNQSVIKRDALQVLSDGKTMRLIDLHHQLAPLATELEEPLLRYHFLLNLAYRSLGQFAEATTDLTDIDIVLSNIRLEGNVLVADDSDQKKVYLDPDIGWTYGHPRTVESTKSCQ